MRDVLHWLPSGIGLPAPSPPWTSPWEEEEDEEDAEGEEEEEEDEEEEGSGVQRGLRWVQTILNFKFINKEEEEK